MDLIYSSTDLFKKIEQCVFLLKIAHLPFSNRVTMNWENFGLAIVYFVGIGPLYGAKIFSIGSLTNVVSFLTGTLLFLRCWADLLVMLYLSANPVFWHTEIEIISTTLLALSELDARDSLDPEMAPDEPWFSSFVWPIAAAASWVFRALTLLRYISLGYT